ncbi:MAG: hypothetical protein ACRC9V_09980 [Aeromonas sp.]
MEFANEKATLHDKGSYSSKVKHYAALREVLLVEDLKNVLPDKIGVYLNRAKVTTLAQAAVCADGFILTHKSTCY